MPLARRACLQSGMLRQPTPTHRFLPATGLRHCALAIALATLGTACWAQTTSTPVDSAPTTERPRPKVERITHEDGGSRVDEVRVGGQTRQIDVQTKSGMPAYQIQPDQGAQGPASAAGQRSGLAGSPGRTSWKLVDF